MGCDSLKRRSSYRRPSLSEGLLEVALATLGVAAGTGEGSADCSLIPTGDMQRLALLLELSYEYLTSQAPLMLSAAATLGVAVARVLETLADAATGGRALVAAVVRLVEAGVARGSRESFPPKRR